jgi:hypothetical protein
MCSTTTTKVWPHEIQSDGSIVRDADNEGRHDKEFHSHGFN